MNEQRLSAYLNLIQLLLTCPDGEEWNVLHQHEELVNTEFVQVMEQVAKQLANENQLESAKFLYYWVEQLNHVLSPVATYHQDEDRFTSYLNLIQALLDCPNGKESEVLAANQELIDSRFVHLLKQVARQMASRGANSTAIYLSNLATEISRKLAQQAEILKPKVAQGTKIRYPINHEESQVNNNYNHLKSPIPAVTKVPEHHTLTNQNVQEAVKTIADSLTTSPTLQTSNLEEKVSEDIPATFPPMNSKTNELNELLVEISHSLSNLEKILTSHLQAPNPLWYMEVLERAQSANWLLTSEEIEQLIGVKPKCEAGKDSFQRGCWVFTKAGKTGLQTAWRISK